MRSGSSKNSDGSYRIRNEEKGWYLGVQYASTDAYTSIIGGERIPERGREPPEQDWYIQRFDPPNGNRIEASMTYTENGAYAQTVTDARGETSTYTYLENRGLLASAEDPRGTRRSIHTKPTATS